MCLRRASEKYIAGAKAPGGAALDRAALDSQFSRGSVVVKALCYKPWGREVAGSRRDKENNFRSIFLIPSAALGPGVYSASNRN
jgi:hypothetical protein